MNGPILGYVRISADPLVRSQGLIWTQFGSKNDFFCLISQEICDFSVIWDLRHLIFLRTQFLQKFWFLAIFLVNWAPK